jgi:SOS-response transcriptional repressor LexA
MTKSKYLERRPALVEFITAYAARHGCRPSAATLSRHLGWSKAACQGYLRRLAGELPLPAPAQRQWDRYASMRPQLLHLAQAYLAENGFAPTLRELAGETGLSLTTLRLYLRRMQQEGSLDFKPGRARSLRVILIGDIPHPALPHWCGGGFNPRK